MRTNNGPTLKKSEILFLYESTYSIPNGDPFTNEQRYDEETKKILVSDVRIKRFIRDYFFVRRVDEIYVFNDRSITAENASGSELRMLSLKKKFEGDPEVMTVKAPDEATHATLSLIHGWLTQFGVAGIPEIQTLEPIKQSLEQIPNQGKAEKSVLSSVNRYAKTDDDKVRQKALKSLQDVLKKYVTEKESSEVDALKVLKKCIDVRLFGGVSTEKGDAVNLTGPVQFALLNPSLNKVDLRMHQNTSVFVSGEEKTRGAIATTTIVPYALNQIHGWINPYSAEETSLTQEDVTKMFKALWESVNNANTRTKSNQNSLLLLQIEYAEPTKKLYSLDRLITFSDKQVEDEAFRNRDDYTLDFTKLKEKIDVDAVSQVNYYTEDEKIVEALAEANKFRRWTTL